MNGADIPAGAPGDEAGAPLAGNHAAPAPLPGSAMAGLPAAPVVLVVDDVPRSIGALCADLEAEGYTVLVASDGAAGLARLDLVTPDAILLDAMMPGIDGFETCRRIKAHPAWSHIPVIFMTGLAETGDIVQGFEAGGVDYVVKPLRTPEVLARLATHLRNARAVRLARDAIDVGGLGVLVVDAQRRFAWRSPKAQGWLAEAFGSGTGAEAACINWLHPPGNGDTGEVRHRNDDGHPLSARRLGDIGLGDVMWLLGRPPDAAASPSRLTTASLTPRETEVLSWVAKGKTNRDVGDILGMSPRTVNKHLEHVFEKLGVETRSAAAALASRELG
jgi:CheY-like chemotaxis protein/DNA-binding CsgD family transcriptional regulator